MKESVKSSFDSSEFTKLMGELSIPGVSKVAKPLSKIFSLFKPKEEDEVKELVERALELINSGYNMTLKALTEKAMQIFSDNVDTEIKVLASRIRSSTARELTQKDVDFLADECDTIFRNVDHVLKEGTILFSDFEKFHKTAEGTLISLVGEYSRILLSCYQCIAIANYGYNMVKKVSDNATEKEISLNALIDNQLSSLYEDFKTIVRTTAPNGYPSWCKPVFTQKEMTFTNKEYSDKLLYAPIHSDYGNDRIYLLFDKKSKIDGYLKFRFELAEEEVENEDQKPTKWWRVFVGDSNKEFPLFVLYNEKNGYINRVFYINKIKDGDKPFYDFNIKYYNETILFNPIVAEKEENLGATTYRDVTIIYKESSDRFKWICKPV